MYLPSEQLLQRDVQHMLETQLRQSNNTELALCQQTMKVNKTSINTKVSIWHNGTKERETKIERKCGP